MKRKHTFVRKTKVCFFMATRNGLEPSTSSVTGWRANRLHHRARWCGVHRTKSIITEKYPFVKT